MKKFYTLFFLIAFQFTARSQTFSLSSLVDFTTYTQQKFQTHLEKKKFRRDYANIAPAADISFSAPKERKQKGPEVTRQVSFQTNKNSIVTGYHTNSIQENNKLLEQIARAGYTGIPGKAGGEKEMFFQKDDITIKTRTLLKDSIPFYSIYIERRELPKPKDIVYAEDLLQINSHEYLTFVFGKENVSKDVFFYSEKETNKCSVLFPKTNQEVVFIWQDELSYKNTAFLVIGGHLQTGASVDFNRRVEQNLWRSEQGIYSGMSLKALQSLNESAINFYSWEMEEAGVLAPKNRGKINFDRISVVLNCLNCVRDAYVQSSIVSSDTELTQDRKVYVSTMIILPQKEKAAATASR